MTVAQSLIDALMEANKRQAAYIRKLWLAIIMLLISGTITWIFLMIDAWKLR